MATSDLPLGQQFDKSSSTEASGPPATAKAPEGNVLPVYFVADESGSMAPVVDELNRGLAHLRDALRTEPMVAAKVRFSMLGFSDDTVCYLELTDLRKVPEMPHLSIRASTSYKSAFEELRHRIPADVAQLKQDGYLVHRPAVFFLTDGQPNADEDWEQQLDALTASELPEHPNILAFGIGEADANTIIRVATHEDFAYQQARGASTGDAVSKFCKELTRSVLLSGKAVEEGRTTIRFDRPEGFEMAADLI